MARVPGEQLPSQPKGPIPLKGKEGKRHGNYNIIGDNAGPLCEYKPNLHVIARCSIRFSTFGVASRSISPTIIRFGLERKGFIKQGRGHTRDNASGTLKPQAYTHDHGSKGGERTEFLRHLFIAFP